MSNKLLDLAFSGETEQTLSAVLNHMLLCFSVSLLMYAILEKPSRWSFSSVDTGQKSYDIYS